MSVQHLLTGKNQSIQRKSYSTATLCWSPLQHKQTWEETQVSVMGHQVPYPIHKNPAQSIICHFYLLTGAMKPCYWHEACYTTSSKQHCNMPWTHSYTHSEILIQQAMSENFKIALYCNTLILIIRKVCDNLFPLCDFCISTDELSHWSTIIIIASNKITASLTTYAWKIAWQNKTCSYLQITFYWENPNSAIKTTDESHECFMMQDCFPSPVPHDISFHAISTVA
jgi:hypothetical protein